MDAFSRISGMENTSVSNSKNMVFRPDLQDLQDINVASYPVDPVNPV